jgi:hypothetical protein
MSGGISSLGLSRLWRAVALLGSGDLGHDRVDMLAAALPRPLSTVQALSFEAHLWRWGSGVLGSLLTYAGPAFMATKREWRPIGCDCQMG